MPINYLCQRINSANKIFTHKGNFFPVSCHDNMSYYLYTYCLIENIKKMCDNIIQSSSTTKIHSLIERELSEDDEIKMKEQNKILVSPFRAKQLEDNASKYWDQFYNRNKTNFFKDRHWTTREFQELLGDCEANSTLLEVGCGVGNLIFPLHESGTDLFTYACDFSARAINFLKNHELYDESKMNVFKADITTNDLNDELGSVQVNIATMVFVLSAIHPGKFSVAVRNIYNALKPGGLVLFRDYGIYDMAQLRFKRGNKIDDNFYMRQDGTRSYFFSINKLETLFKAEKFEVISCCYVQSRTVNKKEMIDVPRVFIQAKFRKS